MSHEKNTFLAKYGTADDLTRLVNGPVYPATMRSVMDNPKFTKRHLATMFKRYKSGDISEHSVLAGMAQHPLADRNQLRSLTNPHEGYPFQGTRRHMWPFHADTAQKRLDTWDLDHDDE